MKFTQQRSKQKVNGFLRQFSIQENASRRCINIISLSCWVFAIIAGTVIIAVGTANNQQILSGCPDTQSFCTYPIHANSTTTLFFYFRYTSFSQNNRKQGHSYYSFLDAYSQDQLQGNIGNTYHCPNSRTYNAFGYTQNVGGYRVPGTAHLHPCGPVMGSLANDVVYFVDSQGATPQLDNGDLVSDYSTKYHFIRLQNYQLKQWIDVQSTQFVNYFTVPLTNTKYLLVGKSPVTVGDYNIVLQNNYKTNGLFRKELIVTEIGPLGATNHFLGFTFFVFGVILLFAHILVCFKWRT